jgi:hypothetical protein
MPGVKVFDLRVSHPNSYMEFDEHTDRLYAVVYAYCEENNLMSALFAAIHDNKLHDFIAKHKLPVFYGARSICCGDFATKTLEN